MKTCFGCKKEKQDSEFSKDRNRKDELSYECKECMNKRSREYYKLNPDISREKQYKKRYGITIKEYEKLFKEQNGVCAICGKKQRNNKRLSLDHNHKTKQVRGLLCDYCNHGLGNFFDNSQYIQKALEYLKYFENNMDE